MEEPRRLKRPKAVEDKLLPRAEQYLMIRSGRENLAKNEDKLKKDLLTLLAELGEEDEAGHRWYIFPTPLELGDKPIYGFKREKRAGSQSLDEEAALALIKEKGLEETCIEYVPVINEDALLAANFEEDEEGNSKISDEELKPLYTEGDPTYAFVLVKEQP